MKECENFFLENTLSEVKVNLHIILNTTWHHVFTLNVPPLKKAQMEILEFQSSCLSPKF